MRNFINTAATDIARARTVGLNQLSPEPFPVLVVGTRSSHEFVFASRGTVESWSGDTDYGLRVTIGDVISPPIASTFDLTVGSDDPLTLPFDFDAAGLQNALNGNATITTDGGVDVVYQGLGRFLIGYRAVGAVSAITVDAALLMPDCTAEVTTLQTGDADERQLVMLTLRRTTPYQSEAWNVVASPYAGWSGTINLESAAAEELIRLNGVRVGQFFECQSLMMVEVIDDSGNSTAYYQTPVVLRALNYKDTTTDMDTGPTRNAQANSTGDSTVIPTSQIHTERITFTGVAGTRNVVITSPDGIVAGARIDVVAIWDDSAENDIRVKIYALSTAGTLLFDFTRSGDEDNALFTVYANGAGNFDRKEQTIPAFPA